jgi:hypothetical protein
MPDSSGLRRVHEGLTTPPVRLFIDLVKTDKCNRCTDWKRFRNTLGGLHEDSIRLWERPRELADAEIWACTRADVLHLRRRQGLRYPKCVEAPGSGNGQTPV